MKPRGHVAFSRDGTVTQEYACNPIYGEVSIDSYFRDRAITK